MKQNFFLLVKVDDDLKVQMKVISFGNGSISEKLKFFYESLGCSSIDIVQFNQEMDLIVDDEGLLFPNKPVFEIPSDLYTESLKIAGDFLIGKRVLVPDEGYETVGFESLQEMEEHFKATNLQFRLIGVTR